MMEPFRKVHPRVRVEWVSGQSGRVEEPIASLDGGIHERALLRLKLGREGIDAVMRLRAFTTAHRQGGRMVPRRLGAAQRCDAELTDHKRGN